MDNMELNNTEMMETTVETAKEITEIAKVDMKKVGFVAAGVALVGAAAFGVKKFVAPKIKKIHEDKKAKKLDKKLKAAAEVE